MSIITFTSDFGLSDHYVSAVKATILSEDNSLNIVDISHQVRKFDISHAAYLLRSVYYEFPKNTIHIIAVNSQDSIPEKTLLAEIEGHFFICPDNGIITLIHNLPNKVVALDNQKFNITTFPAKDIYSKIAVLLAQGKEITELGAEIKDYKIASNWHPRITKNEISGIVIRIDDYGNAITNIRKEDYLAINQDRKVRIAFSSYKINSVSSIYSAIPEGDWGAVFNSNGYLELFCRKGNSNELLGLEVDISIYIEFDPKI